MTFQTNTNNAWPTVEGTNLTPAFFEAHGIETLPKGVEVFLASAGKGVEIKIDGGNQPKRVFSIKESDAIHADLVSRGAVAAPTPAPAVA